MTASIRSYNPCLDSDSLKLEILCAAAFAYFFAKILVSSMPLDSITILNAPSTSPSSENRRLISISISGYLSAANNTGAVAIPNLK